MANRYNTAQQLSKKDLVKLFTPIPHEFIDDFYDILDSNNSQTTMFPIKLDLVARWLKVSKNEMKYTLIDSYKEGYDYTIRKAQIDEGRKDKRGGLNKLDIWVTIDAFKRLCMRSRSKKAEDVRTYFIELDNFVTMYTTRILNGLLEKLNKPRKIRDGSGWIYIFRVKDGIFKLGHTKNLLDRVRSYNVGRLDGIEMVATLETSNRKKVEQCVKTFCKAKRLYARKELFKVDEDIIRRVMQLCVNLGDDTSHVGKWTVKKEEDYYIFIDQKQNL